MASSVTFKDIAQQANVSTGTVSRVFNNHSNVNDETKQKVLKVAAELGYVMTTRPTTGSLKQIGFLLCTSDPDNNKGASQTNPFWSAVLHGVESEAARSGIGVTYKYIDKLLTNSTLLLNTLAEMNLGGILLVGPADTETVELLQSTRQPLVLVDNYDPQLEVDAVLCQNLPGAEAAVNYLIEAGHQRIAWIGGPTVVRGTRRVNRIYTLQQRQAGYQKALIEAGLGLDADLMEECDITPEGGYAACKRLLERGTDFTALFCGTDPTAIGAIRALSEAGRKIPQDVSVVGFDDIDMAGHLTPPLTTVRVEKEAMGSAAVRALIARLNDPEGIAATTEVRVRLIKRASVAKRS